MRLWSLHPRYLDPQGLVALWREALLAKVVLQGQTKGYTSHPQLHRFQAHPTPRRAISAYLGAVHAEAADRGYAFDRSKVGPVRSTERIPVTAGQLEHEWSHLLGKLKIRSPEHYRRWRSEHAPQSHPLLTVCAGRIEPWERGGGG